MGGMLAIGLAMATQAPAAEAPQRLGQCMAAKTTGEDRLLVARWMLAGMASAPQMADIVTVTPGKKDGIDRNMAALFTRLLVRDCPDQSRAVFKLKTGEAFQVAGESLGRVAMEELMTNPRANAALIAYVNYLKEDEFKAVTAP